jgi:hypothetical protein
VSTRIGHGYRIHHDDINWFLDIAIEVLGTVRDKLDAALYADKVAEVHDHALRGTRTFTQPTLRDEALAEYMTEVTAGSPGYVWHHPHSLDIDYARPNPTGPWYVLLHAQCGDYHEAFRGLPGVEPYEYWNHTDPLDGVTDEEWQQRRADWAWLIDARTIRSVTQRRTYREDPAPNLAYVTHPAVLNPRIPSRDARAKIIARDLTCAAALALIDNPQWEDVHDVMWSDERRQRASRLAPAIAALLPDLDASDLDKAQSDIPSLDFDSLVDVGP